MRPALIAPLIVAPLLLSACNLAPEYRRPALPVAPAFPGADAATSGFEISAIGWRDFFMDARLRSVIELALGENRDLRIAAARVEQARALYRIEGATLLPAIGGEAAGSIERATRGQAASRGGDRTGETWSVGIGAAWELDLFGRMRSLSDAALQSYFATQEARNAVQISLVAETANAWLTLAADQRRLAVAEATRDAFLRTLELSRARHASGVASNIDVRQAETSHEAARVEVARLHAAVRQDRNALELLAGASLRPELLPTPGDDAAATLTDLPVGIHSAVLLGRPDIRSAEHELKAANANIGAARAAFFPSISLTGFLGTISNGLSGLFGHGGGSWTFAPSASLPIFDGGRNRANLAYSEASRDLALARYEKSIQTAFREVADALARRATIGEQLDAQRALARSASDLYRLAEARYRTGSDSFLVTLDAQRTLFAAQQDVIAGELDRDMNLVDLYRRLGGGLKP